MKNYSLKNKFILLISVLMVNKANGQILYSAGSPLIAKQASNGIAWNNVSSIKVYDGSPANCTLGPRGISKAIRATKFDFQIPNNATLKGIKVRVTKGDGSFLKDKLVMLLLNDSNIGVNKKKSGGYTSYPMDSYYGSSTDLWAAGLSIYDVNSTGFGVAFKSWNTDYNASHTAFVDYIGMTVYYTVGPRLYEQTSYGKIAEGELSINPNPASEKINFSIMNEECAAAKIMIYNFSGSLIISIQNFHLSETNSLDITSLISGVYFLKVETPGRKIYTKKFIRQ